MNLPRHRLEHDADVRGLSEEFRQPVMEGMVGISPFVGNMDLFVEAFNGWERFVALSEQSFQPS